MSDNIIKVLNWIPTEISLRQLPSNSDVLKALYFETQNGSISTDDAIHIVSQKICAIWDSTKIPIIYNKSVVRKLTSYMSKFSKLSPAKKDQNINSIGVKSFKLTGRKLFDIAVCNCTNLRKCICTDDNKVPLNQQLFLADQRGPRRMLLSDTSYAEECGNSQKQFVLIPTSNKIDRNSHCDNSPSATPPKESCLPTINLRSRFIECSYKNGGEYNTVRLHEVAKIADRYNVGDTVAAALATATLIDFQVVSPENKLLVVDRNKVRRSRKRVRDKQVDELTFDGIQGLYFDGRKDKSLNFNNNAKKVMKEEHLSFVQQPDSFFIGHKAVSNGTAETISEAATTIVSEKKILVSAINAIGCDGTVVNTGHDGGVIRLLELKWNKTLQWIICMLHLIELPFRALFEKLDGPTTGKTSYGGPLGKRLPSCVQQKVAKFTPVKFECCVPNIDLIAHTLSSDQKYLFEICTAISNGYVSPQLAQRSIGPICPSRWTTLANRLLRLFVSEPNPSPDFRTMVEYVMLVYAPAMFRIKYESSIVFGSVHLAEIVKSCRFLPEKAFDIVKKSIQRNGYFAHPENVTLAMLNDNNKNIRKRGWLNVLQARQAASSNKSIRIFKVPPINFNCRSYTDLVRINRANPPILRAVEVTKTNIDFLADKPILEHDFGTFLKHMPVHTQPVERCVKLVTEASKMVCGEKARDGLIANTIASRNVMAKFNSKKDYAIHENTLKQLKI